MSRMAYAYSCLRDGRTRRPEDPVAGETGGGGGGASASRGDEDGDEDSDASEPKDAFNLVFLGLMASGMGYLLPYNG